MPIISTGVTSGSGDIQTERDLYVGNNLFVTGTVSVVSDLYVSGTATLDGGFSGNLSGSGDLLVGGESQLDGDVFVSGTIQVQDDLVTTGSVFVTGELSSSSGVHFGSDLDLDGNAFISGSVHIGGQDSYGEGGDIGIICSGTAEFVTNENQQFKISRNAGGAPNQVLLSSQGGDNQLTFGDPTARWTIQHESSADTLDFIDNTNSVTVLQLLNNAAISGSGDLLIGGESQLDGDVFVSGTIQVQDDLVTTGSVFVTGELSSSSGVHFGGDVVAEGGNLFCSGTANVAGSITSNAGNIIATTGYVVAGDYLRAAGNEVRNSTNTAALTFDSSANVTLHNNLTVPGTTTLTGLLSSSSELVIDSDASLGGATGSVHVGNLFVSGTVQSAGDLVTSGSILMKGASTPFLEIDSTAGNDAGITLTENGTDHWQIKHEGSDNSFQIRDVGSANVVVIEDNAGADKIHISSVGVGIGAASPAALLEVEQGASGGQVAFLIDNDDTDKVAMKIEAANIDADVIDITADAVQDAKVINISADDLTTGNALYIDDNSSDTGTRSTVSIIQNNAAATGATPLTVQGDGNGALPAILIDKNFTGTTSVGNGTTDPTGLLIDYDVTGIAASGQTIYHDALSIKYNQDSPTMVGVVVGKGIDLSMTGSTSGFQSLIGASINVAGADANTGLQITAPAYDTNQYHIRLHSAADSGDYFVIGVGDSGATTFSTTDDDGTNAAHLSLSLDGYFAVDTALGVVFNEAGNSTDFRIESDDEEYMFFLDASNNRISIGDSVDDPAATLEITNHASAGATGVPLLQLNNNDVDKIALDINAANTTAPVIDITADAVEDSYVIHMSADALTTGGALFIDDDSSDTGTRSTVDIRQNNAAATGATALTVISNGGNIGMTLDKNASGTAAQNATALHVDFDRTVPGSGTNAHNDIGINLDVNSRSLGTSTVIGMDIDVTGHSDGTSTATGLTVDVSSADTNYAALFNGGNVGIGATDPVSLLEVRGGTGSGATGAGILTLSTAETTIVYNDVLGKLQFQAPKESSGTDAIAVAASIEAVADTTFDASSNYTNMLFKLGESGAATEKMKLSYGGHLQVGTTSTTESGLEVMNKGNFRRSSGRYYLEEFFVKRPQLNATIDQAHTTEAARSANENFEITGRTDGSFTIYDTNVFWPSVSGSSEAGGMSFQARGVAGDQCIIQPHTDIGALTPWHVVAPDQPMTAWSGISWKTDKSLQWECAITTGGISVGYPYGFWAGLGLSSPGDASWSYETDDDQAFFMFNPVEGNPDQTGNGGFGDITSYSNMHFVYSVGGTDYITDLNFAVSNYTTYRFRINIDSSRRIKIHVNDTWYAITRTDTGTTAGGVTESTHYTSNALTDDKNLTPYIGIQAVSGSIFPSHQVHYQKISRLIGY